MDRDDVAGAIPTGIAVNESSIVLVQRLEHCSKLLSRRRTVRPIEDCNGHTELSCRLIRFDVANEADDVPNAIFSMNIGYKTIIGSARSKKFAGLNDSEIVRRLRESHHPREPFSKGRIRRAIPVKIQSRNAYREGCQKQAKHPQSQT